MSSTKEITIESVDLEELDQQLTSLILIQHSLKTELARESRFPHESANAKMIDLKIKIDHLEGLINFIGEIVAPALVNSPVSVTI